MPGKIPNPNKKVDPSKGALCKSCGRHMLVAAGCTKKWLKDSVNNKVYLRQKYGEEGAADPGDKCHDCGAHYGHIHHDGCDMERCPKCNGQMLGCECWDNPGIYLTDRVLVDLELVGLNGNAYALLGAFIKKAKQEGWPEKEIDRIVAKAKDGDYDHLLSTLAHHCGKFEKKEETDAKD